MSDKTKPLVPQMTAADRDAMTRVLRLLSLAKMPNRQMTVSDETLWQEAFTAGAWHMLDILAKKGAPS